MTNGEISFDFELTKENEKALKELLNAKGLVHYMIETKEKEKLDLVEYKDYQQLEQEIQKYKSLYQNEKDKNDTLKRIINRCVEEIYNLIDDCDSVIGNKESSIVSKNKLMLMQKEKIIKILDLLKEIK